MKRAISFILLCLCATAPWSAAELNLVVTGSMAPRDVSGLYVYDPAGQWGMSPAWRPVGMNTVIYYNQYSLAYYLYDLGYNAMWMGGSTGMPEATYSPVFGGSGYPIVAYEAPPGPSGNKMFGMVVTVYGAAGVKLFGP